MKLSEIEERQAAIRSELNALATAEDTTEEDHGDLRDTLIQEHQDLDARKAPIVERMEKLKLINRSAREGGGESGDGGGGDAGSVATIERTRTPEFMTRLDPFAELDKVRRMLVTPKDMIARAKNAVELHDKRGLLFGDRGEAATRKAGSPNIARHMLLTGHDEYMDSFEEYLNDPQGEGLRSAQRSLTLGTASGGYLLPYVLDPTIILTSDGSTNPYRRLAEVKQTTSNAWQGVNSAGVTTAWLDEAGQATDANPAVGQIQIYPKKGAAWVLGSFEVMGDTNFAEQLPGLLADAKDVAEELAFAVGTGGVLTAGQPLGIINAMGTAQRVLASTLGGTVAVGGLSAGTGCVVNIYNLNAALGARFRLSPRVGWVSNIRNINAIRALDQYGGGSFWANLGAGQPERLLDKPILESPSLTASTAIGTALTSALAVFGDWSKFVIVDRIGTTMLFDPLIKGAGTANMPTGQQGWFYYWRVGSGVATANAFRWLANGTG